MILQQPNVNLHYYLYHFFSLNNSQSIAPMLFLQFNFIIMAKTEETRQTFIDNRRARHEYYVLDSYEAGIELKGTEVKSLRAGKANLTDAYARIKNEEVVLIGLHISPYEHGNINNHDPLRTRKCLLHKREIFKIKSAIEKDGFTLVPMKIFFTVKGKAKVELGVCKGKQLHDKRESIKERDTQREMNRAMREKN